ncbi:hypothetical protein ARMSODRAFT_1004786, partial [Armillaria solidipes]
CDLCEDTSAGHRGAIKVTWLGHASFLVNLPDRCSPTHFLGLKRYTEPPCKIEDIPEVDTVVISHN